MNRHRKRITKFIMSCVVVVGVAGTVAACTGGSSSAQSAVNSSNNTAQIEYNEFNQAAPYPYTQCTFDASGNMTGCLPNPPSNPLERENLAKRLTEYNSKGDTNYVYVFAGNSGNVVGYYVIEGKVSSTGSEMTSTQVVSNCDTGGSGDTGGCTATDAIGDDGSYGPEEGGDQGVFFFTSTGVLVETDMPFLVSSAPISIYQSVPQLDAPAK